MTPSVQPTDWSKRDDVLAKLRTRVPTYLAVGNEGDKLA